MPNRSITKTMLEDHALGQCFSTRGREIKLQYNIFTNIMTRMLSHVKKYIAYTLITVPPLYIFLFRSSTYFSSCVIQTERLLKTLYIYHMIRKLHLSVG